MVPELTHAHPACGSRRGRWRCRTARSSSWRSRAGRSRRSPRTGPRRRSPARRRPQRRGAGPRRAPVRLQQRRLPLDAAGDGERPAPDRDRGGLFRRPHRGRGPLDRRGGGPLSRLRRAPALRPERPRLRRAGRFYFTDLGKVRHRDQDRGAVYYARADGSLIRGGRLPDLHAERLRPVAGRERPLRRRDRDRAPVGLRPHGTGGDRPPPVPFAPWRPAGDGVAGATTGSTRWRSMPRGTSASRPLVNGGITIVSPDGASVRTIPMPERWVTNICFGGPDLRTAYITLSSTGRLVSLPWERRASRSIT